MKKPTTIILLCSILFASFVIANGIGTGIIEEGASQNENNPKSASHDPIIINGTAGFEWGDYPDISGNGSLDNPYIIENLIIDAGGSESGIFIKNTEQYLEIRNCQINNSGNSNFDSGIRIEDSLNVNITECSIFLNYNGISIISSENINISGNGVRENFVMGIILSDSKNNTISENDIYENLEYGISLIISENNTLSDNDVRNNFATGIFLSDSKNNTISENEIYENLENGISFIISENNTLLDNDVRNNFATGIFLDNSQNNSILENTIFENIRDGVIVNNSLNVILSGNEIYDVCKGIVIIESDYSLIIENKVYDNKENGILFDDSHFGNVLGNRAYDNYGSGIFLDLSHNITLSDNKLYKNSKEGIFLNASHNSTILSNFIYDNGNGFSLLNSENSTILINSVYENNENGVLLNNSHINTFSGNEIHDNYLDGINLFESHNNLFSGNKIYENYCNGISLEDSGYNSLTGNYINDNFKDGIFSDNSHNTSIFGCVILENDGFGVFLDATSNDTTIWANDIVNNTMDQAYTISSSNNWDNGTFGNFWGDYTSKYPAALNDGLFWDTPYEIEEVSAVDNYPLLQPILPDSPILISTSFTNNETSTVIEWFLVNCAETYDIYVDGIVFATTSENSIELMLDLNDVYEISVIAVNIFGESFSSSSITITIEIPPEIPVITTAKNINEFTGLILLFQITKSYENITIQWNELKNVDYFNIYIDGNFSTTTTSNNSVNLIMEVNGVYNITVTAINNVGESLPSKPIVIIVDITPVHGYILSIFGIIGLIGGIFVVITFRKNESLKLS
ncbi:MAG: right-handed parallel beta-helix repeat-containing protein [Promethearchaeota archaeon]